MRIAIATLGAKVEWGCNDDGTERSVVLYFGSAEITRWPIGNTEIYHPYEGDPDAERKLEQFVADKLKPLLTGCQCHA